MKNRYRKHLTTELVYANITCVMEDERRKQTEQKLIRFGKEEFLKKDMQSQSPRDLQSGRCDDGSILFFF